MSISRTRCLVSGILLLAVTNGLYAYDNDDFQVWNTEGQEFKINGKAKIVVEEEFRYGNNGHELYYQHYDTAFAYAFNKNLDLTLSYRHVIEKKRGKFRTENEPNVNAILKWDAFGCKLSNRFRFEYRHFNYQADAFRYRNMLTVRLPWKFTKFEINPYFADEVFVSSLGSAVNNNRFYAGLSFILTKHIKGDLYYLLQHTRTASKYGDVEWPRINVLGTKIKLIF